MFYIRLFYSTLTAVLINKQLKRVGPDEQKPELIFLEYPKSPLSCMQHCKTFLGLKIFFKSSYLYRTGKNSYVFPLTELSVFVHICKYFCVKFNSASELQSYNCFKVLLSMLIWTHIVTFTSVEEPAFFKHWIRSRIGRRLRLPPKKVKKKLIIKKN